MIRPDIQEAIARALCHRAQEVGDSAERAVMDLLRACSGAAEDWDWRALGKLMELRLKHLGMLTDKLRVEGADGGAPAIVLRWSDT